MKRSKEHRPSLNLSTYTYKHTRTKVYIHILRHYKQGPLIKLACVSNTGNKADGIERPVAISKQKLFFQDLQFCLYLLFKIE